MRIVIDARFYGTEHTGLGRYTTNILSHLPPYLKQHQLFVLLRRKYYDTLTLPPNCTKVPFDVPHYSLAEQLLLPLKLQKLSAELLYTLHFNTPVFTRVPTVVTIHDLIKTYFSDRDTTTRSPWLFKLKRLGYDYVLRRSLKLALAIIVPTNTVKNQILAHYPIVKPELIFPIPEAPDPLTRPTPLQANLSSPTLMLPDKYLLFVGNAYPHKNLRLLLEAHKLLKDQSLHLVLVSKLSPFLSRTLAPYEPRQLHIFSELSDSDLRLLYRRARALVTPSLMEGYGLVALEALQLGVPVVASNIPVYREVYGSSVTYFDPHSVPSLTTALKTVLESRSRLPVPNLPLLNRTWDDVAKAVAEVIDASRVRLRSTQ